MLRSAHRISSGERCVACKLLWCCVIQFKHASAVVYCNAIKPLYRNIRVWQFIALYTCISGEKWPLYALNKRYVFVISIHLVIIGISRQLLPDLKLPLFVRSFLLSANTRYLSPRSRALFCPRRNYSSIAPLRTKRVVGFFRNGLKLQMTTNLESGNRQPIEMA